MPGWINDPKASPRDTMIWAMSAARFPDSPAAAAEIEALDADGGRLL